MLSVDDSKIIHRQLILWARFNTEFVKNELIPEIENNCLKFKNSSQIAIETFEKNKFAQNSMYFHHGHAYADIPIGQEYEIIAPIQRGKIQYNFAQPCKTKVLCFFSQFKILPVAHSHHGHHENSLIQFKDGIPMIIQELYELDNKTPLEVKQEICLCSKETLQANYNLYNK